MATTAIFRFLSLLAIASSLALCAPLKGPVFAAENSLEERNPLVVRAIARIGTKLVKELIKGINEWRDDQHAAQELFTTGMIRELTLEFPDQNVIIYHDQDSTVDFQNAEHDHFEFDLGIFDFTKGYETYVFDSGTFTHAGDGGFINWRYAGNYVANDNVVVFSPIQVETPPPVPEEVALPPRAPVRSSNANDGNYFVNCQHPDGTLSSGVAYYSNLNPGQNVGQQPDDYVDVTHGTLNNWEQTGSVVFPSTSVAVHWSVFGGSQDQQKDSNAGTADNGYQNFWVYKDSGEYLYTIDDWTCYAVYFAF